MPGETEAGGSRVAHGRAGTASPSLQALHHSLLLAGCATLVLLSWSPRGKGSVLLGRLGWGCIPGASSPFSTWHSCQTSVSSPSLPAFGVPCQSLNQDRTTLPQGWLGEALPHLGCPGMAGMWDWYSRGRSREARASAGAEGRGVEGAEKTWGELCLFSATAPWQRRGGHKAKEFALCRFSISEGAAGITGWGQGVPAPSGRAPAGAPVSLWKTLGASGLRAGE